MHEYKLPDEYNVQNMLSRLRNMEMCLYTSGMIQ